jgi:hypothetical protein
VKEYPMKASMHACMHASIHQGEEETPDPGYMQNQKEKRKRKTKILDC